MTSIRWQMRWLILGLMLIGVSWVHLLNYVRLGRMPRDMLENPASALVLWGGAVLIGLLLDAVAGWYLRGLFVTLGTIRRGEPVPVAARHAAAIRAIAFPERAALVLLGAGGVLSIGFHAVSEDGGIGACLADAVCRPELSYSLLREMVITLLLAVPLFTVSRRLLQRAVAECALRSAPGGSRVTAGARSWSVIMAQAVMFIAVVIATPADAPLERMAWQYGALGLFSALTGYLVATDTGQDLRAISGQLRSLASGVRPDLSHRLAVTSRDEVADLVGAINGLQDRVEQEFRAIERDLQAARAIQTAMLPRPWQPPPGWDLAAHLTPAQEVGGDLYDIIPLPGGRFGIAVGDAAGKGLPAALLMSSVISLIRSHAPRHSRPAAVLEAVNELLHLSLPPLTFVTAAYAVVDPEQREITLASAGHLPPIIGGREAEPLPALPLGVEPLARYPECTFRLDPGQAFIMFSDGLVEATDPAGCLLGFDRVADLARRLQGKGAAHLAANLAAAATGHRGGLPPQDDVTVVALVSPAELRLQLRSRHGEELIAARAAAEFARTHGPADRAEDVATAVGEVCLNAIVHGNRLQEELPVQVRLTAGPRWLEAVVSDAGPVFAPPAAPPSLRDQMEGDGPIGGWGLALVQATADLFVIEERAAGKQVRLHFSARGQQHVQD